MQLSSRDQLLLQRYRDREMTADEAASFRSRLEDEPDLRRGLAALEQLARGFAAGRERVFAAPAGFTAGVLAAARQLPDRLRMEHAEASAGALVLCRRLLLAAVVLFGLGLCWQLGLFDRAGPSTLQAGSGDVRREMEREMDRLDAIALTLDEPAERPR